MTHKKSTTPTTIRDESFRLRMSAPFKAWLDRWAVEHQLTATALVTQALIAYAKAKGHEPPPRR